MDKFAGLPDISLTQPDRLIKYRISEDRFTAEVLLPGFAYTDFDQKIGGKLYLWSIFKLVESVRWQGLKHGFAYYPELIRERGMFVVNQECHFAKKVHEVRKDNAYGVKFPMKFYMDVSDIGKTSFTTRVRWMDFNDTDTLGMFLTKAVYVDRKSRKPIPLPSMFSKSTATGGRNMCEPYATKRSESMVIPDSAFRYRARVLHSDTDMYHHANQASFVKWASDAAALAAVKGKLLNFKRHVELYPYRNLETQYLGEVLVNTDVTVFVWDSTINPRFLCIVIKSREKTVFSMKMEFHEGPPSTVAPHLDSKL